MKKVWGFTTYILVILSIIKTVYAIFLGDIAFIVKGIIYIAFTTSLFFRNKLTTKNKVVEITSFISVIIIIFFDYLKTFLKL